MFQEKRRLAVRGQLFLRKDLTVRSLRIATIGPPRLGIPKRQSSLLHLFAPLLAKRRDKTLMQR